MTERLKESLIACYFFITDMLQNTDSASTTLTCVFFVYSQLYILCTLFLWSFLCLAVHLNALNMVVQVIMWWCNGIV